jgi:hypothetical protein
MPLRNITWNDYRRRMLTLGFALLLDKEAAGSKLSAVWLDSVSYQGLLPKAARPLREVFKGAKRILLRSFGRGVYTAWS